MVVGVGVGGGGEVWWRYIQIYFVCVCVCVCISCLDEVCGMQENFLKLFLGEHFFFYFD